MPTSSVPGCARKSSPLMRRHLNLAITQSTTTMTKDCDGISMGLVQSSEQELVAIGDMPRVSPIEDDILAYTLVTDKKLLDFELELFATKWFDYRELTPLQATRLYIQAFVD